MLWIASYFDRLSNILAMTRSGSQNQTKKNNSINLLKQ